MAIDVKVLMTLQDRLSGRLKTVERSLGTVQTRFTELRSAVSLVREGINTFARAVEGGFRMGQAGAELERTRGQLDNLAASIGTTSDVLLREMGEASGGLMSNAEMIQAATDIISLGLAENQTDVIRLATIVSELGWDMQQVILTFANNSKMRLDALGLSVQDVEEKTEKFIEAGMSMDQAFDQAVLEAAEEKIKLIGSAAETSAGQYKILEASIKDVQDEWKRAMNAFLLPYIIKLNERLDVEEMANKALELGLITEETAIQAKMMGIGVEEERAFAILRVITALEELAIQELVEIERLERMAEVTGRATRESQFLANASATLDDTLESAASEADEMADVLTDLEISAMEAKADIDELNNSTRDLGNTNANILDDIKDTIEALEDYASPEMLRAKQVQSELQGLWEQGIIDTPVYKQYLEELIGALEAGNPVAITAGAAYLGMGTGIGLFAENALNARDQLIELEGPLSSAADEAGDLADNAERFKGTYTADFYINVHGDFADFGGGLGGGGGGGKTRRDRAHSGADFVVPPGFPNDSFPLRVESGEHVKVTPAHGTPPSDGGMGAGNITILLDGEEIAYRLLDRQGRDLRIALSSGAGLTGV